MIRPARMLVALFVSVSLISGGGVGLVRPEAAHAATLDQALAAKGRIAGGGEHSIAVRPDGTVVTWGADGWNQRKVPPGLSGVASVAAGWGHSLALKTDGTVVGWGDMGGEVPAGLTDAVDIAARAGNSIAARANGTAVVWGGTLGGEMSVPDGLSGVSAVAAGDEHFVALRTNGTVVAWGDDTYGQASVPAGLTGVVAIAAGGYHSLALRSNGTVVAWGLNGQQQCAVPSGLSGVVAIAAGFRHSLALRSNGTVVAWGGRTDLGTDPSVSVPSALSGVVAIAAGEFNSLALRADGTPVGWGSNSSGQSFGVTSLSPPSGTVVYPPIPSTRIAGADRVATAVEVSKSTFANASAVIVATAMNFPDALAAAPLAHAHDAPILLVPPTSVPPAVSSEITRLGATKVIIVGGTGAVSATVETTFKNRGLTVERIAGTNRYDTAARIATALRSALGVGGFAKAYVATGENFPDALAAGGVAAFDGAPILLTQRNTLPSETRGAVTSLGVSQTVLLGGTGAVSAAVAGQLPSPTRIAGPDRYSTGVAVATYGLDTVGMSDAAIYLATGQNYPDALAAGAASAASGNPVVLAQSAPPVPAAVSGFMHARAPGIGHIRVLGGTSAVANAVVNGVRGTNPNFVVTFNAPVQAGTSTRYNRIALTDKDDNPVPHTKALSGNSLIITPSATLGPNDRYQLTVPARALRDAYGTTNRATGATFHTPDTIAPTVVSASPPDGATGIYTDTSVSVFFSESVLQGTAYADIALTDGTGTPVPGNLSIHGSQLRFIPSGPLDEWVTYTFTVPAGAVKDQAGNALATTFTLSFTTAPDVTPPTVVSVSPPDGATEVGTDASLSVTFSEAIAQGAAFDDIVLTYGAGIEVPITRTISGSTLIIEPTALLDSTVTYTLTVPAGAVEDTSGNALEAPFTATFTTGSGVS